jgi:hypothetical protein
MEISLQTHPWYPSIMIQEHGCCCCCYLQLSAPQPSATQRDLNPQQPTRRWSHAHSGSSSADEGNHIAVRRRERLLFLLQRAGLLRPIEEARPVKKEKRSFGLDWLWQHLELTWCHGDDSIHWYCVVMEIERAGVCFDRSLPEILKEGSLLPNKIELLFSYRRLS